MRHVHRQGIVVAIVGVLVLGTCATLGLAARPHAGSVTVASITLSPIAVTLSNPARQGGKGSAQDVSVTLTAQDAQGQPITQGSLAQPITVKVYGPLNPVLTTTTSTIRSPQTHITFHYDGRFFPYHMVVTAVSGHAGAEMAFLAKHHAETGSQSFTFHMPNLKRNMASGWGFSASLGGGPKHYVQMDTGSRGIVVPVSVLGPDAIGPGAPAQIEYTSSGKIFSGYHYLTPVTLSFGGTTVTTVPIEVLGVNKSSCAPGYSTCRAGGIKGLGMMGVGFGRGGGSSGSLPSVLNNAFLALTGITQGTLHPGYIITANSVTLGITSANKSGYDQYALKPSTTSPGDWLTEAGCFSFPTFAGHESFCGTMLVDTGIASMILALPVAQRPTEISSTGQLPKGVSMHIAAPSGTRPALAYSFVTGDRAAMTPTSIRWGPGTAPFVNTGRRPISHVNYLFDAGSGRVGFKKTGS